MVSPYKIGWQTPQGISSRQFTCGHCGAAVATNSGYVGSSPGASDVVGIYLCHFCTRPTFFDVDGIQIPGATYGRPVEKLPSDVLTLYEEARKTATMAPTGSALCSRKLLMNVAVSKGAKEGLKFIQYIEYLADNNFIPAGGREWVDHIRKVGNEATHEIRIVTPTEACELVEFAEMLLKFVFEFPGKIKDKVAAAASP